jgi:RES domain
LLAPPPVGQTLDVKYYVWDAQRPMVRVCSARHSLPNAFNPTGGQGRFRPFDCGTGNPVPTMYAANHMDGALAESVFHDVPAGGGPWSVPRASLFPLVRTILVPQRQLRLVDLTGWAHKALRLNGRGLIDCDPSEYPTTAMWAERFHDLNDHPDGLYWRSRQNDRCVAVMLFGDRVNGGELRPSFDDTIALWQGDGLDEVSASAERANITIVT